MSSELAFKRWFVERWDGWLFRVEPRLGGDVGVADMFVVVDGSLVPVELKLLCGSVVSGVRPSQRLWHRSAWMAGVVTLFVAGEKEQRGGWRVAAWLGREGGTGYEGWRGVGASSLRDDITELVRYGRQLLPDA